MVYLAPPVIKWVVVWDFRLFTTLGSIYRRGVITWGKMAVVSNESCCHILGRWGCDNNGCDSSGCKFSPPHSRQAVRSVIVSGVTAPVAKVFRCHTPGRHGTKACDTGSKGCDNKAGVVAHLKAVRVPYRCRVSRDLI